VLDHGWEARRNPSESWFSDTTVSRIAIVGKIVCQGVKLALLYVLGA
jgi:hypothetical protein